MYSMPKFKFAMFLGAVFVVAGIALMPVAGRATAGWRWSCYDVRSHGGSAFGPCHGSYEQAVREMNNHIAAGHTMTTLDRCTY